MVNMSILLNGSLVFNSIEGNTMNHETNSFTAHRSQLAEERPSTGKGAVILR